jgi:biopolymer transport protein ExbB
MNLSPLELWQTMGWFARGVLVLLLTMSAIAGSIAVRKGLQLTLASRASRGFSRDLTVALAAGDYLAAQRAVEMYPASHLAHVMSGVFPHLPSRNGNHPDAAAIAAGVERTVEINLLAELAELRRGLGGLATIGATAPFVGLLGTVMGIVNAFTAISSTGSGGLAAISAGIAEALVATAVGLLVAIPAVWLYNYFINRIEFLAMEMTCAGKALVDAVLRQADDAVAAPARGREYAPVAN